MENIIDRLIDIENQAKDLTYDIEQEKNKYFMSAKERMEEINQEIQEKIKSKIAILEKSYNEELKQKLLEIEDETQRELFKIQEEFDKNHHTWEEQVLKTVVGDCNEL